MRVLISKSSRRLLLLYLKGNHHVKNLPELSQKLGIPKKTISDWIYNDKRYIPEKFLSKEILSKVKILDKKENNWGKVNGGKKTYETILKKYGEEEMQSRRSKGGKKSKGNKKYFPKINLENPLFLEFYGVLLGDGWIGEYGNKRTKLIGISGHLVQDKEFFLYLKKNIKKLFNRNAYLKEKPPYTAIELQFSSVDLFKILSQELSFPVGKKVNLGVNRKIFLKGFKNLRYVIRGLFDTDGSFYLDKTPLGNPYPCISIDMKAPKLINQVKDALLEEGFKVVYRKKKNSFMITLKGKKQLKKWMEEIGSSNPKHFNKIQKVLS